MNLLHFFDTKPELQHPFGRGINASISPYENELFNKSYEAFEKNDIINTYEYFFKSLENFSKDAPNQNIITYKEEDKLKFEIYQGSAKVVGYVTKEHLSAEVIMMKKDLAHVALKRYILERNYQLTYACYFSDEQYIKLKLYHDNITMTPQKIFYPLREIALNADYDKEYMRCEFPNTVLEDIQHLQELDENELKIKYDFLHQWINEINNKVDAFHSNDNAGMQAFSYLSLLFKIDYLLVPKFEISQNLTKKVQEYFGEEDSTTESKNEELRQYIDTLKKISFNEFCTQFYNSKYTFNPTDKTSYEEINAFINESLIKIRWYKNNRYYQIIPIIYNYIGFYILYNYGLHPVTKALLHTLVEIQNPSFFNALGYPLLYREETSSFSKRQIISKIEEIIIPYQNRFKALKPFGNELDFSSLNEFSNSFYVQLKHLNFEEV
ncbi:hypothetical protein KKG72_09320 [bacterium]|nr:hypothetical protein [bacterium]MBU1993083.1 hypothetical protein [bacterium]